MKLNLIDKRMFRYIDWLLFANIMVLVMLGFIAIASALSDPLVGETSSLSAIVSQLDMYYVYQQLMWLAVGLVAMFVILLPDYHAIGEYYKWIYIGFILLLVAVYLFGAEINGTKGWFRIGNSGFQPSELGKVAMIIIVAKMISNHTKGQEGGIRRFRDFLPILLVFAVPLGLIVIQPDMGTALVYVFMFLSMIFVAKTSWKILLALLGAAGIVLPVTWTIFGRLSEKPHTWFF